MGEEGDHWWFDWEKKSFCGIAWRKVGFDCMKMKFEVWRYHPAYCVIESWWTADFQSSCTLQATKPKHEGQGY